MDIINMLPGGTFIVSKGKEEILFKNQQITEMDWVSGSGVHINEDYRFKIIPFNSISDNKADAVRLYENEVNDDQQ